ncbi:hypothetical protein, partial [Burkholderia oklahomensis]|uniref:hypothetical protein n=1 Tax=Burkholderia oklahomensis TaxID=342113 RepID=UPI001E4E25A0
AGRAARTGRRPHARRDRVRIPQTVARPSTLAPRSILMCASAHKAVAIASQSTLVQSNSRSGVNRIQFAPNI